MSCLMEKEIPLRGYTSDETFQAEDPKRLMEKAKEYRAKSGVIHGKSVVKAGAKYQAIKYKRLAVASSRNANLSEEKPTMLDFIRANRPETVQIFSAIIAAAMILSLASSLLFGVHIV